MTDAELDAEYRERHRTIHCSMAAKLCEMLGEQVANVPRIDRVAARAKTPDRFLAKATKQTSGKRRYERPLDQIQDQIGARIVTFYLGDVERVASVIDGYFRHIEERDVTPESESEFGYVGKHYILLMPEDLYTDDVDRRRAPKVFELQIKTLFQHAWSEAGHDLAYKPAQPLTSLQKRQLAFTAAQAWGADQMFSSLWRELDGQKPESGIGDQPVL